MNDLRGLMERLRPLVGETCWDYCVFWGLSEDQSCFEFLGCCCGGAENDQRQVEQLFPVSPVLPCRDMMFQHQRSKFCHALEKLPSSIPMDSAGNHAEALLSNQPRWLIIPTMSNSDNSDESVTTMVLIPVAGGLVELFVSTHVPEDGQIVEFVMAQCNSIQQWEHEEAMEVHVGTDSMSEGLFLPNGYSMKSGNQFQHWVPPPAMENQPLPWDPHLDNQPSSLSSQIDFMGGLHPDGQPLINEHVGHGFQSLAEFTLVSEELGYEKESVKYGAGGADSGSGCSDQIDDEEESVKASGRGHKSKNLVAERKRRKKLNDRMYELRALVPRITKMDRASILKDAIDFIKELQQTTKDLQDELEEAPEEDGALNTGCDNNGNEKSMISVDQGLTKCTFADKESDTAKQSNDSCPDDKEHQMEPQVEVSPVGEKEFFLKVLCEHKPRGFVRLMEAMSALGLEVTNSNVTTFKGLVSNVFRVEKRKSEAVQADQVRESLLEVTRSPTGTWLENERAAEYGTKGHNNIHHHIHHLGHQPIELNP